MSLILPSSYQERKRDYKSFRKEDLHKRLESFINESDDVREPYYILVKISNDALTPLEERMVLSMYVHRKPPFFTGSMVFWVDNSRGLFCHLWTVNHRSQLKFNYKTAEKLKGILRGAAA